MQFSSLVCLSLLSLGIQAIPIADTQNPAPGLQSPSATDHANALDAAENHPLLRRGFKEDLQRAEGSSSEDDTKEGGHLPPTGQQGHVRTLMRLTSINGRRQRVTVLPQHATPGTHVQSVQSGGGHVQQRPGGQGQQSTGGQGSSSNNQPHGGVAGSMGPPPRPLTEEERREQEERRRKDIKDKSFMGGFGAFPKKEDP